MKLTHIKISRNHRLRFACAFLRSPKSTGSLLPSSRYLVDRMLRQVQWRDARIVVELGPGLGCFTREILRCMGHDSLLLALETNTNFVASIKGWIPDPRLHIVHASAAQIRAELTRLGLQSADCIISGLPFLNMPALNRRLLLEQCHSTLRPGGKLVLFQYRRTMFPALRLRFDSIWREYELLNFPPAHVFSCLK